MTTRFRKPVETKPQRMAEISKLPVFLELKGKRAVVLGGSSEAAAKVELLAAAGANVEVYATEPHPEMLGLIADTLVSGSIVLKSQPWTIEAFENAAIAVADIKSKTEAKRFYHAATKAGVPVCILDKPKLSQFEFGSILNQSSTLVSVSADTSKPALERSIVNRLDLALRQALASWSKSGNEIQSSQGRVTLVGAGPGDPELLTLKAVRALQSADVILFDDLVSDDVLELARNEAKKMLVGKRGHRESCRQTDINELMIKLAKQGKHVVRLKSGDPMIFGRAGEEIAILKSEGIAAEVVPGITAGIAMASELGVSLTHRDHSHSVRFITGHARNGQLPTDLEWAGIADPETTLIFYMGGRTAASIAERLMAEGLKPNTPVRIATSVSRADSQYHCTTLARLRSAQINVNTLQPVLIGIGHVFKQETEGSLTHPVSQPALNAAAV